MTIQELITKYEKLANENYELSLKSSGKDIILYNNLYIAYSYIVNDLQHLKYIKGI